MNLTNTQYDVIKFIAQTLIPALASLYFGLCKIWGLPFGVEVVGTLSLIDTFIGVCLTASSKKYEETSYEDVSSKEVDCDGD